MATDVLKKGVVIVREPGFRLLKTFHDGIHGVTGFAHMRQGRGQAVSADLIPSFVSRDVI